MTRCMRTLVTSLVVGCGGGGQTPIETVIVSPLRIPCQGFGPDLCLEMTPDRQPTERVFFGIEGFSHRWGIESEITIRREAVNPPVPDGPSENLIMLETVVENPRDPSPFDMTFPFGGGSWFSGTTSPLTMIDGTLVECEATVCTALNTADVGNQFVVSMELVGEQTIRALAVNP
jgi:hypothetical protein